MLFNSIDFFIFLPVVFLLYWFTLKTRKWRNLLIVIVSYIFYGWWDPRFLVLIAITSLSSYYSGLLIERYEKSRKRQKMINTANIILNLGILVIFKYFNFFLAIDAQARAGKTANPRGQTRIQNAPKNR